MSHFSTRFCLIALSVLPLTLSTASAQSVPAAVTATEASTPAAALTASDAYAFPSLGMNRPGIAFLTLHNPTDQERALVGVSADTWCDHGELHTHITKDGVMSMQQVEKITIPAHGSTTLKPGGLHIMLMGIIKPLKAKDTITLTLTFDDQTTLEVPTQVRTRTPN